MLTRQSIDDYEKRIEDNYRREKELIERMRALLEESESGGSVLALPGIPRRSEATKSTLPPLEENATATNLSKKIEEICFEYRDEMWSMRRMLAYLRQIGFSLGDKPEGSISAAMGKLAARGKLKVVKRGSGSAPNIYQWNKDYNHDAEKTSGSDEDDSSEESENVPVNGSASDRALAEWSEPVT